MFGSMHRNTFDTSKIYRFLGCSEMGSHSDEVFIEADNRDVQKLTINFSNWTSAKPEFDDHIAIRTKGAARIDNEFFVFPFECHVYSLVRELNGLSNVSKIVLPYCPNIHIFGITFVK